MAGKTIELARDMSQRLSLEPGTTVLVRLGAIRLRLAPQWLAETWIQDEFQLNAEGHYLATAAGNFELTALDAAEVLIIPAGRPGRWTKSVVAVRQVLHALCASRRSIR